MSDLDQTFAQYVERIGQNKDLMDQFVHGGPEDTVQTEGGPIPTLAGISKAVSESGGYPMYADTATGIASTIEGQYFKTPSAEEHEAEIIYRHNPGAEAFRIAATPESAALAELRTQTERLREAGDPISVSVSPGFALIVEDADGRVAVAIRDDGSLVTKKAEVAELNLLGSTVKKAQSHPYAWAIEDENGNIAFAVTRKGTFVGTPDVEPPTPMAIDRLSGIYSHELNYICNAGQSLGEGSDGEITLAQEYDNIGFAAGSTDPTQTYPLQLNNPTEKGTRGESPMYGTLGFIKRQVEVENGVSYLDYQYQLLGCNNADGGEPIADLSKGGSTGMYEAAISQVQAGLDFASATGRSFSFQAVTWTQGENDTGIGTSYEDYLSALLKLADDYNTDGKAITGQHNDVQFITYQCTRDGGQGTVAAAQLKASELSPNIHLACPTYQLTFYDFQHIDALSSKWLGGYYGLVYKRVVIDKKEWVPLKPVRHSVIGSTLDLLFTKSGLTFDTDTIALQTDYGFSVVDAAGDPVTISSIALVGSDRVRFTFAQPVQAGWRVRYGWNSAVNHGPFTGGAGNLRDNQGNWLIYEAINKPMHNWCVLFDYEV